MANALTLTAAAMPAAAGPLAGVIDSANSNGQNSAGWSFSNGATGAADTIANAELLKGVGTGTRLYAFLNRTWTDQAELDGAAAALGFMVSVNGGSLFYLVTAGNAKATATMTTAAATGMIRASIGHSMVA